MERRLSPRLPRAADRRNRGLLPRLSRRASGIVARTLAEGFAYQGEPSPHRNGAAARRADIGARRHRPSSISCRTTIRSATARCGERLTALAPPAALEAALAITLLAPGAAAAVHGRGMGRARAVSVLLRLQGRSRAGRARRPPPRVRRGLCASTRTCPIRSRRADRPARYARLERARAARARRAARPGAPPARRARTNIVMPRLPQLEPGHGHAAFDDGVLAARWNFRTGEALAILANLSDDADRASPTLWPKATPIWGGAPPRKLAALVGLRRDRGALMPPAIPLATYRLQLSKDFGFDARRAARALSQGARRHASLCLAVPQGAARQRRTATTSSITTRSIRSSAARRPSRVSSDALKDADLGLILDFVPNHMAVGCRQRLVARRAGMGPQVAARGLVRHRLGAAALPPRRRRAAAGARQALWRGADRGRDRAEVRSAGGQLLGLVFRSSLSDQSAALQRHPQDHRGGRRRGTTSPPAARCSRSPPSTRTPGAPSYARGAGVEAAARRGSPARADVIERGLVGVPRRPRERRQRAAPAARAAALPPRLLAGRRRPASTTAASSTSTIWPGLRVEDMRARSARCIELVGAADRRRPVARAAARSHRRAARPAAIHRGACSS